MNKLHYKAAIAAIDKSVQDKWERENSLRHEDVSLAGRKKKLGMWWLWTLCLFISFTAIGYIAYVSIPVLCSIIGNFTPVEPNGYTEGVIYTVAQILIVVGLLWKFTSKVGRFYPYRQSEVRYKVLSAVKMAKKVDLLGPLTLNLNGDESSEEAVEVLLSVGTNQYNSMNLRIGEGERDLIPRRNQLGRLMAELGHVAFMESETRRQQAEQIGHQLEELDTVKKLRRQPAAA